MAYEIVKRLKGLGDFERLNLMEKSVSKRERKNGKRHNVFQPPFDAQLCLFESFTRDKLNYIHCNHVKGKWELAEDFLQYSYSSARFYEDREHDDQIIRSHSNEFIN
ncbi:MAG: hypothetical protein ACI9DJ_001492 [Algoriphagus sp.]|jgi:hypothetical protein